MDKDSIARTAFVTNESQWEFMVLPFGVTNGPSFFSRVMFMILGHLNFVQIYLDDLLIHSKTLSDNYIHVEEVFELLKKANLKLNFSKCCWFAKEFKFLGHVIAEGIIKVDNDKIKVVQIKIFYEIFYKFNSFSDLRAIIVNSLKILPKLPFLYTN